MSDVGVDALSGRIVEFADGLIGCPTWHRFRFEAGAVGPAVHRLRCLDEDVSLLVVDPFAIEPEFAVELPDEDAEALGVRSPADAMVLVTLTVRDEPAGVTANLLGPLIVNVHTGQARQVVLSGSPYVVRHPIAA